MKPEAKEQMIREFVKTYNDQDYEALKNLLHPQVSFRAYSNGQLTAEAEGPKEFCNIADMALGLFQSRTQAVRSILHQPESSIAQLSFSGIFAMDTPSGHRAGQRITVSGKTEFKFLNDKIVGIMDFN